MKKSQKPITTSYSKNKKAFHDFEILETYDAGIILNGDEVKSIKYGQANLKGAFVDVWKEEAFMNDAHVSKYKFSNREIIEPNRKRKLILHKKEILKIEQAISQKGVTAVPLELYGKNNLIKLKVGICRGKKLYDKRDALKKRDQDIEIKRSLKRFQ